MKPIQKLISLILTLLIIFNIVQPVSIQAADHVYAINSEGVNVVSKGTATDSKYSFSFRNNDNTHIEIWGYTGKILSNQTLNNGHYGVDWNSLADCVSIYPQDDSLSDNIGCWIYNVGTYKGKQIDVKCTYSWTPLTIDGVKYYPVIDVRELLTTEVASFLY